MTLWNNVLFFIFPPACEICKKTGKSYLCEKCKKQLENSNIYLNQIDNYHSDDTKYFDVHYYLFSYNSPIREKILQYKFFNKPYLYQMFSEFFIKNEKVCGFFKKDYDIIIPVPMTKKKTAQRGYNQSTLIAKQLAKNIPELKLETKILLKHRENKKQSLLTKKERIENVKDVYKIQNQQKIKDKNIILFDDIYTTGATVNECAKTLKLAGAKLISVITIAKDFQK